MICCLPSVLYEDSCALRWMGPATLETEPRKVIWLALSHDTSQKQTSVELRHCDCQDFSFSFPCNIISLLETDTLECRAIIIKKGNICATYKYSSSRKLMLQTGKMETGWAVGNHLVSNHLQWLGRQAACDPACSLQEWWWEISEYVCVLPIIGCVYKVLPEWGELRKKSRWIEV